MEIIKISEEQAISIICGIFCDSTICIATYAKDCPRVKNRLEHFKIEDYIKQSTLEEAREIVKSYEGLKNSLVYNVLKRIANKYEQVVKERDDKIKELQDK